MAAAALGLGFLYLTARTKTFTFDGLILDVRVAAVALSLGAAFALDDPARETTAGAPASVPFQRALRVAVFLPVLAMLWWLVLTYAGAGPLRAATGGAPPGAVELPVAALSLEFMGMVAVTWAAAAVAAAHVPDGLGGIAAGPILFGFLAAGSFIHKLALFAGEPGNAAWATSHQRWGWVLAAAVAVLILASRDPARARRRTRSRLVRSPRRRSQHGMT